MPNQKEDDFAVVKYKNKLSYKIVNNTKSTVIEVFQFEKSVTLWDSL